MKLFEVGTYVWVAQPSYALSRIRYTIREANYTKNIYYLVDDNGISYGWWPAEAITTSLAEALSKIKTTPIQKEIEDIERKIYNLQRKLAAKKAEAAKGDLK